MRQMPKGKGDSRTAFLRSETKQNLRFEPRAFFLEGSSSLWIRSRNVPILWFLLNGLAMLIRTIRCNTNVQIVRT